MEWLNLHTSVLDHEAFAIAEDAQCGTWLRLMRYCIGQENGGRIRGAATWPERKWTMICRVNHAILLEKCDLWSITGEDVVVWGYPKSKQAEVQAKREGGRIGGLRSAQARANQNPKAPSSSPSSSASTEGEGKEKGKDKVNGKVSVESIYLAYPKHVGKQAALKAIAQALKTIPSARLLECSRAYAAAVATWPAEHRDFIPHPAKWFNDGRFDDDPGEWVRGKNSSGTSAAQQPFNSAVPHAHTGGLPIVN